MRDRKRSQFKIATRKRTRRRKRPLPRLPTGREFETSNFPTFRLNVRDVLVTPTIGCRTQKPQRQVKKSPNGARDRIKPQGSVGSTGNLRAKRQYGTARCNATGIIAHEKRVCVLFNDEV
jgi:hypothetical protein